MEDGQSLLIMDNVSFHHLEKIKEMCSEAGVELLHLPPYSPNLNPIEESFSELKHYIKHRWEYYETWPERCFDTFLQHALMLSVQKETAESDPRHARVAI